MARANPSQIEQPSALDKVKKYRIPIIIILIWGGIIGYNVAVHNGTIGAVTEECPGHWHAIVDVYVGDELISYGPLRGDPVVGDPSGLTRAGSRGGPGMHLHDDTGTVHYHPNPSSCNGVDDTLEHMDMDISGDNLVLGSIYPDAGTYGPDSNHTVMFYYQEFGGSWKEVGKSILTKQLGNGDRFIIAATDGTMSASDYQSAARSLSENYTPQGEPFPIMPVIAVSIFAALALVIWNKFQTN